MQEGKEVAQASNTWTPEQLHSIVENAQGIIFGLRDDMPAELAPIAEQMIRLAYGAMKEQKQKEQEA